jgi:hypothetical protein
VFVVNKLTGSGLSINLHVVVHLSIELISSLSLPSVALVATTTTAATTATTGTTVGALGALILSLALVLADRGSRYEQFYK